MFMRLLFDLSFQRYATPDVVRALYVLGMIVTGLAALGFMGVQGKEIVDVAESGGDFPVMNLALLVSSPVFWIVSVIALRIWSEFMLVIFRISEQLAGQHR